MKPSRCLHEAFTQWARRGASAKGSRRLHERFMKTSRALKASRSLREGFAKASRRLQPYPRRLREGFAKAPRAPPFGNDSSDNDKPPYILTPPRLIRFEREGMRRNYRGNIANEINMLECITFATRCDVVVGVSF